MVARLREVSLRGVAKVKFTDKIKVPENYTDIINEWVLDIKVAAKSSIDEDNKEI